MKCTICRKRFVPTAERVYQTQEGKGVISALTTPPLVYDVIDCPRCGCQHPLKVRMTKVCAEVADDD